MLSILIPVYNNNITRLVSDLHDQCTHAEIVFEIICLDDGSEKGSKEENKIVSKLPHCIWEELTKNVGRASIRNKLGKRAKYNNLLFIDGDSAITRSSYIITYMTFADNHPVIYGGREYNALPPRDWRLKLHHSYGSKVESKPDYIRNRSPWLHFMSNNFLIDRDVFLSTGFDDKIIGYGYEDLVFAGKLKKLQIPVFHIDNPVLHATLDSNENFLLKTEKAIDNLLELKNGSSLLNEVKLVKTARYLHKTKLDKLTQYLISILLNTIKKNLLGKNPRIMILQFFKLYLYIKKGRLHL